MTDIEILWTEGEPTMMRQGDTLSPLVPCGCGEPLDDGSKLCLVEMTSGKMDGQTMVCHERCLKPAPGEI